jgi:outer membrane protein assembly factor BamB
MQDSIFHDTEFLMMLHGARSNLPRLCVGLVFVGAALLASVAAAEDWPQWRGPTRDGVWMETGLVEKFAADKLEAKWRAPIGSGYSGPTVSKGKVYLMDRLTQPEEVERILCLEEQTGKPLWTHAYPAKYGRVSYPAGPRASVTIHDGRAYAIGTTGRFHCLDAESGKIHYEKDLEKLYDIQMPIWGIAGSPLIVDNLVVLHIGGKGKCIVALDRVSGEEKWTSLADRAQYTTPILVQQAGQSVIVVWTGDAVSGLEPLDGKELWRFDWRPKNMPIGVATPIVAKDQVFFTSFYDGSLMLKLAQDKMAVEKVWQIVGPNEQDTDALQSIISTPVFDGGNVYGVDSYGQLRGLEGATGKRLWENLTAVPKARWSTIHFVKNGDKHWLFNERGELIIAQLAPTGYTEISRAKLLEPTTDQLRQRGGVCWSHPAYANKCIYARNDKEIVCASLEAK